MLEEGITRTIRDTGVQAQITSIGALFCLYFAGEPVTDYASAKLSDTARFASFFWDMLAQGVYLPPSQFEAWFISLALKDTMIEETVQAVRSALHRRA